MLQCLFEGVAELVDALALGAGGVIRGGSSPPSLTTRNDTLIF